MHTSQWIRTILIVFPILTYATFEVAFNEHFLDPSNPPDYKPYPPFSTTTPNKCTTIPLPPTNFIQYIILRTTTTTAPPPAIAFYRSQTPLGPHCTRKNLQMIARYHPTANTQQWFTALRSDLTHFKVINAYDDEWQFADEESLQDGGILVRNYFTNGWSLEPSIIGVESISYDFSNLGPDAEEEEGQGLAGYSEEDYELGRGRGGTNLNTNTNTNSNSRWTASNNPRLLPLGDFFERLEERIQEREEMELAEIETAAASESSEVGTDNSADMRDLENRWSELGLDDRTETEMRELKAAMDESALEHEKEIKEEEKEDGITTAVATTTRENYWDRLERLDPIRFSSFEHERARQRNELIQRGTYTPVPRNRRNRPLREVLGFGYHIDPVREFEALKREWAEEKFADWKNETGNPSWFTSADLTDEQRRDFIQYLKEGGPPAYLNDTYIIDLLEARKAQILRNLAQARAVINGESSNVLVHHGPAESLDPRLISWPTSNSNEMGGTGETRGTGITGLNLDSGGNINDVSGIQQPEELYDTQAALPDDLMGYMIVE
ncbi:hypothetical protein AA313_de0205250 [Arthrobotrys entomopaga]|nr:hypothetical protein AA313_de0205250 [Arthrobotrys entomopaga]